MPTVEELMEIPGAVAAGEFDDQGNVIKFTGDISETAAEIAALMAVANRSVGNMEAKGWTAYTGKDGFFPVQGFAVAAGKYAACIMGNKGVFVELEKADFDQIFKKLAE